jgi:hypothetical protein
VLLKDGPVPHRRPRNVDPADRAVRIAVGLGLLAAVVLLPAPWHWLGWLGLAPLASGIAGWCPVYAWLARD